MVAGVEYKKFSLFERGLMLSLLRDAYSFEPGYERDWLDEWRKADDFFFDNLDIADRCGFVTTLAGRAIGFICWDPRHLPDWAEVGHNCIASAYKGLGLGRAQLMEAIARLDGAKRVIVTTDERLAPARANYESAGFKLIGTRPNDFNPQYAGCYMDYELSRPLTFSTAR